ncbi:class I SAM-dependent methyltransferase [Corynebacterium gerontici]|uniref:Arsenite S-adenosylmethyltransferase n=1 Tax=Corynebacterium gerontici TaxID=2079234 RepID=A0A3G6J2U7_9CORY|nr:class I SAM-dependent methyltransferase [Corynebacterium gerontici]AZA10730.1 arsenite S-adenosylmethyltransferase [Corynebacterium gerontici]
MSPALPMDQRPTESVPGHWLLARLGKRVLRPGGLELTTALLDAAQLQGKKVAEFAPGIGKTAKLILQRHPASYIGIDEDPQAVALSQEAIGDQGQIRQAQAQATGLESESLEVVVGEAMLTMQGAKGKSAIINEAYRVLEPGGRYCIHELSLRPDGIAEEIKQEISKALARSIHVNARPLTQSEWQAALEQAGFKVISVKHAGMELLDLKRNIDDEGIAGTTKILFNLLRMPAVRKRVMAMRKVFHQYSDSLAAIAIVAEKPA